MNKLFVFSIFLLTINLNTAFGNQIQGKILAPIEASNKLTSILTPLKTGLTQQNQFCTIKISKSGSSAVIWATEGLSGKIKFQSEINFLKTTVIFSNASNDPESVVNSLFFDGNNWAFISSFDTYFKTTKVSLVQNNRVHFECIFK